MSAHFIGGIGTSFGCSSHLLFWFVGSLCFNRGVVVVSLSWMIFSMKLPFPLFASSVTISMAETLSILLGKEDVRKLSCIDEKVQGLSSLDDAMTCTFHTAVNNTA